MSPKIEQYKSVAEKVFAAAAVSQDPSARTALYAQGQSLISLATLEALTELTEQMGRLEMAVQMLADRR